MDRLTERTNDGILVKEDYGENVLKTLYQCYGAEPNPHYNNYDEGYCGMEKLAEYEDLEEQGKLLKLPCTVGDTLYFPYIDSVTKEKVISKEEVTEIGLYYRVGNGELSSCSEIGSIIFLTKSEAKEALKKMNEREGENGNRKYSAN